MVGLELHVLIPSVKWILRPEGVRDHVDMLLSMKFQPNITIVDFVNMVTPHGEKW